MASSGASPSIGSKPGANRWRARAWITASRQAGSALNAIGPSPAEQVQAVVLVGLPDFATHRQQAFSGSHRSRCDLDQNICACNKRDDRQASINEIIRARGPARGASRAKHKQVPYILIAPRSPNEIGEAASRVYERHYAGVTRAASSVSILGRFLRAGSNSSRGELLSYLFFSREFTQSLIERGENDARRWLARKHDDGPWRLGKP